MNEAEQLRIIPKREPGQVLERAIAEVNPSKIYVLFSGGKDSSVTLEFLWREYPNLLSGVIHVDTTIADPETAEFSAEFCRERNLDLHIVRPARSYEEMVLQFGFFGPGLHSIPYNELKNKPIEAFARAQKRDRNDRILLLTGVRADESARRAQNTRELTKRGSVYYSAPLIDYSRHDMERYRTEFSVPKSPCANLLCMSGDCFCGAKAKPEEIKDIKLLRPVVAEQISLLEEKVRCAGFTNCVWGVRPTEDDLATIRLRLKNAGIAQDPGQEDATGPLCINCMPTLFDREEPAA